MLVSWKKKPIVAKHTSQIKLIATRKLEQNIAYIRFVYVSSKTHSYARYTIQKSAANRQKY